MPAKTEMPSSSERVPVTNLYDTGSVQSTGFVVDGLMDGAWAFFRKDGTVMRTGEFMRNLQVGKWRTFDRSGRLVKETAFTLGTPDARAKP